MRRRERVASTVAAVLDVQREITGWTRALTNEGHATIRQALRRLSAEPPLNVSPSLLISLCAGGS